MTYITHDGSMGFGKQLSIFDNGTNSSYDNRAHGVNIGLTGPGNARVGSWFDRDTAIRAAADILQQAGEPELAERVREAVPAELKPGDFVRTANVKSLTPGIRNQLVRVVEGEEGGYVLAANSAGEQYRIHRERLSEPVTVEVTTEEVWTEVTSWPARSRSRSGS
jgi:hypothetical protein